jgi:dsRNA-specific ribonuclease
LKVELRPLTKEKLFIQKDRNKRFFHFYAFLGDVLIDLFLRQKLFQVYVDDLKRASLERNVLASERVLSFVCRNVGIEKNIDLSEQLSDRALATLFEAYCCGIYLDYGLNLLFEFLEKNLWSLRNYLLENFADFITKLRTEFPNHKIKVEKKSDIYEITLILGEQEILKIQNKSKKKGIYEIAKMFYTNFKV